jgi:hypothetical protein
VQKMFDDEHIQRLPVDVQTSGYPANCCHLITFS